MWVEICVLVVTIASILVLHKLFGSRPEKAGLKKPPGPWQWPLLGNLPQLAMADAKYTHIAFGKLAEKYGDVMSLKFGVHDTIVLSSYEAIRDLMGRPELAGRYDGFPHTTDRSFGVPQGISFTSGELWQTLRRFTVRSLRDFGFGKRGSMSATVAEELSAFCNSFESAGVAAGGDGRGFLVTIEPSLFSLSFVNILWSYVAGYRFSHSDDRLRRMLDLNDTAMRYWNHSGLRTPFPFLRHVLPGQQDRKKTYNELHTFMKGLINETESNYRTESPSNPRNFIECFIQQISNGSEPNFFNFDQLNMVLQDLFLGGSETTSSAMTHAILYMTLNPDVQEKVYTLVRQVKDEAGGNEWQMSATDLHKMPYVEATIHEIFRYAQLGPIMAARKCMADVIYRDYVFPKGTPVFATLYAVMMDPKYWGDPESFRPERFLDNSGTQLLNLERMMPFGFGKRVCPAESMARESFFLLLAGLMLKYRFELPPGTHPPPSAQPMPLFILRPYPFRVLMRHRA